VAAASLLDSLARGYYFIEVLDGMAFDYREDRFRIPASGFTIRSGRAVEPVARAVIAGRIGALLHGIQAVARDLTFVSSCGVLGSPTLLVKGVELDEGD
jgi:predicted Zn-dependent protease